MSNNHIVSLGEKSKTFLAILSHAVSSFLDYAPGWLLLLSLMLRDHLFLLLELWDQPSCIFSARNVNRLSYAPKPRSLCILVFFFHVKELWHWRYRGCWGDLYSLNCSLSALLFDPSTAHPWPPRSGCSSLALQQSLLTHREGDDFLAQELGIGLMWALGLMWVWFCH